MIQVLKILNKNGVQNIGIHAHDNLKLALKNSLLAIQKKVKWVDCTITEWDETWKFKRGNFKTSRDCFPTNEFCILKNIFLQNFIYNLNGEQISIILYAKNSLLSNIHTKSLYLIRDIPK